MKFLGPPSSGSIAETTFAHNRGGQYTRARAGRGGTGDLYFSSLALAWQSLLESERLEWIDFARQMRGPVNSLGARTELSGFGWFCRQNLCLNVVSGSVLQSTPLLPAPSANWQTCVLASALMTTISLDVTITFPPASSGAAVLSSSGVVTPGTMSAPGRNKYWQNFWVISWNTTDLSPLTIPVGFAWFAHFGSYPLHNDWLFIGLRSQNWDRSFSERQRIRIQTQP